MSSSSDSEGDGEETKRLKAAAVDIVKSVTGTKDIVSDSGGLNQERSVFQKVRTLKHNLVSKRPDKAREQVAEHELQTTPEFRSFVAKKLTDIIDSAIKVKQSWTDNSEMGSADDTPGIRLFSSSKPISDVKIFSNGTRQREKSKNKKAYAIHSNTSDSSDDETVFASVAVSGESIISNSSLHRLNQEPADTHSVALQADKMKSENSDNANSQKSHKPDKDYSDKKRHKKRKHSIPDS